MKKWNGIFNYYGEIHNLWTTAENEIQARRNLISQMVERLGLDKFTGYGKLRKYFSYKANFEIRKED